ncbi:MAG: LuxR C-terminal-related transcriptional regulator [Dehalococcoidia bacterium]
MQGTHVAIDDSDLMSLGAHAWADLYAQLSRQDRETGLDLDGFERLAVSAYLIGKDGDSADAWAHAFKEAARRRDTPRAVRCAFWLAFALLIDGQAARGNGWLARARRLLDVSVDCVEQGYLQIPVALQWKHEGDPTRASAEFEAAAQIGERFADGDLAALARSGQGEMLIRRGAIADGMRLLDEVMVAVTSDDLSPIVVGTVYCAMIETCLEVFDVTRAQQWTEALNRWSESQQGLVPYRRQCLVHRAEIMRLQGAWPDAMDEAKRASALPSPSSGHPPGVGSAFYQQADLHRLRGDFDRAEEAYRLASHWGRSPEPGIALLRLVEGRIADAARTIRRALAETPEPHARAGLLGPYVEIMLVANAAAEARSGADELAAISNTVQAPLLEATSSQVAGAVLLEEGEAVAALSTLRGAVVAWAELGAPYETARARALVGVALQELGDESAAEVEFDGARLALEQLGAEPDLLRLRALRGAANRAARLSPRETEVLRLVAAGKTNREIALDLGISGHTVRRHLQNMFAKLAVPSRAAATAYGFEHGLL